MKPFTRNLLICLLLLVPLYYAGSSLYIWMFENLVKFRILINTLGGPFFASLVFGVVAAMIPFALVLCWKFGPVTGNRKRLFSVLIVVVCAMIGLLFRVYMINRQLAYFEFPGVENYEVQLPFDALKLESYFFGGTIAGFVIVWFVLRDKKKPRT